MHDHIATVVGRYKGRIKGWDVVNEAVEEDGTHASLAVVQHHRRGLLALAFKFAHEADPAAELYYNDYSIENAPKRNGAVSLIRKLQAQGIHVAAMGLQGHDKMGWPTVEQQDSTIAAFAALGVKVNITELDVDVLPPATRESDGGRRRARSARGEPNPYCRGLPDSVQQALAKRYADLFAVFLKHRDVIDRVTFWGVADGGFVAEQLARSRTNELSVVVRPPASAEAGVRRGDRCRASRGRRTQSPEPIRVFRMTRSISGDG